MGPSLRYAADPKNKHENTSPRMNSAYDLSQTNQMYRFRSEKCCIISMGFLMLLKRQLFVRESSVISAYLNTVNQILTIWTLIIWTILSLWFSRSDQVQVVKVRLYRKIDAA